MRRIVRLTERDLSRIVRQVIREEEGSRLPLCSSKMKSGDVGGKVGSGSEVSGDFTKITYNGSVAPQYQGYTVYENNKPFCFISTSSTAGTPVRPADINSVGNSY